MSQILILSFKLYKHEKRTPVDAERDMHGVCTRSTADDCRVSTGSENPKRSELVRACVRACVCACGSFWYYYYYVRVLVPAADICPFVSPPTPLGHPDVIEIYTVLSSSSSMILRIRSFSSPRSSSSCSRKSGNCTQRNALDCCTLSSKLSSCS